MAWFSLWVREVPGSTPGQAPFLLFYSYSFFLLYVVGHLGSVPKNWISSTVFTCHWLAPTRTKVTLKRAKKTQLALQHCCKTSWMAMLRVLPPTNQNCFTTNQVVAGYEKLLQKVESSSNFGNKICTRYVTRFTGPRQTCFTASDLNPVYGVTPT